MASQLVKELEAASLIILASPNQISPEQRHAAEEIFLNFRMTKMPYQLCRDILETSKMDFVLHESVRLIKSTIIKEWDLLPSNDVDLLRNYLFHYIINKPTIAPFVREQVIQVIALMIKRKSVEDKGETCNIMLNEIESLILNGNSQQQLIGCGLILALLQFYSTSDQTTYLALTLKVHLEVKEEFQCSSSKRIFKFCVNALSELVKGEIMETQLPLVKQLITIIENVLTWNYDYQGTGLHLRGGRILQSTHAADPDVSLRLDRSWANIIFDPMVTQFFFTLYWKIRTNLQIAHHARRCLIQLANFSFIKMGESEGILKYLNEYITGFIKLVSNIDIIDQEAAGMAEIIRGLLVHFYIHLNSLNQELRESFIDQMMRLTHIFSEGASQEESLYADDCLYMEAFEIMLNNWLSIWKDDCLFPAALVEQSAVQIFNLYVKCRLSPPDGNRRISGKQLTEYVVESEENDRSKYKKQLQIIGNIARKALGHSLVLLIQLLESRVTKMYHELRQVSTDPKCNLNGPSIDILNLYEDIHWLVLLSRHVLCMESNGETPVIPAEIIKHSIAQKKCGTVDPNMSLQLFVSPQSNLPEISVHSESFDHAIRLSAVIFRLAEIERMAIKGNISYILSPELSSTIIWFLQGWILNYLLPDESDYNEMSATFYHVFGGESIGAQWTVDFLLEKIHDNITAFMAEKNLMEDVMELFLLLATSKPKFPDQTLCVLKSDRLGNLIELAMKNHLGFSQVAKRGLLSAIVKIGMVLKNDDEEQYWTPTIKFIVDRFNQILSGNGVALSLHQEDVKIQIIDSLDCFIGTAQGVVASTAHSIFRYIKSVLYLLPNLLRYYHHYQVITQLIFEFLHECSGEMLNNIDEYEKDEFYRCCIQTIEAYARSNINRVSVNTTEDEEDAMKNIMLLMKLLCGLLLGRTSYRLHIDENVGEQNSITSPADVGLAGLNLIMPIMTMELLKYPSLCNQYYKLISCLSSFEPHVIYDLQGDLHRQLMSSIELGLTSFGDEITEYCCSVIKNIAAHIADKISKDQPNYQMMAPFMNLLMNLIISRQIDCNIVSNISNTLHWLMVCYYEQFPKLVEDFLAAQPDSAIAEKWASAFARLTANMTCGNKFVGSQYAFRKNFNEFIATVLNLTVI